MNHIDGTIEITGRILKRESEERKINVIIEDDHEQKHYLQARPYMYSKLASVHDGDKRVFCVKNELGQRSNRGKTYYHNNLIITKLI